nr:MAG TPA: Major capsid protein [Bacteriophage sp.]
MGLQKQIWQSTLVENFYPNNSFAVKSVDDSTFVNNNRVHIPNAGTPSGVKVNRTIKPATQAGQRIDQDLEYTIDELTTEPIFIPQIDTVELSYDKRNSVISNDRAQLQDVANTNLLWRWASAVPKEQIILTTGTTERDAHTSDTSIGKRKRICKEDIVRLMTKFDTDNIPEEGRYLLLDAYMYADLLSDLADTDKWAFTSSADTQNGIVGKLYGFNVMKRSRVLRCKTDKTLISWDVAGEASELACALAWHEKSVSRAMGEIKMFDSTDNPMYYGDIYSFLLRTGGAVRRYDKKGVYLLAEAMK